MSTKKDEGWWLKDFKTGEPSLTITLLVSTFAIAGLKLLLSSITIGEFSFETFEAQDFAIMVGAMGAIYGWRKSMKKEEK